MRCAIKKLENESVTIDIHKTNLLVNPDEFPRPRTGQFPH